MYIKENSVFRFSFSTSIFGQLMLAKIPYEFIITANSTVGVQIKIIYAHTFDGAGSQGLILDMAPKVHDK